jgi:hypothetical protein
MFWDGRRIGSKNRSGRVLKLRCSVGIYPERPIFHVKIGMILIGSKGIQGDPGLFSLHFTGRNAGSFCVWGREGRVVDFFLKSTRDQYDEACTISIGDTQNCLLFSHRKRLMNEQNQALPLKNKEE